MVRLFSKCIKGCNIHRHRCTKFNNSIGATWVFRLNGGTYVQIPGVIVGAADYVGRSAQGKRDPMVFMLLHYCTLRPYKHAGLA